MNTKRNLIGKPFPKVDISVKDGEIYVTNDFHVYGVKCPFSLKDKGYFDEDGNLYFEGRSDDIVGVRGRKVSKAKIEAAICEKDGVSEAAVVMGKDKDILIAYVSVKDSIKDKIFTNENRKAEFEQKIYVQIRKKLAHFEMPRRIVLIKEMPHNKDTGKIDRKNIAAFLM